MKIQEIGESLRKERERQGLSLVEVMDRTKISRACLEAIERGDREGMPHPVYARGFIKSYALLLGLDGTEFARSFDRATESEVHEEEEELAKQLADVTPGQLIIKSKGSRNPVLGIGLLFLGLFVLIGGGWLVYDTFFSGSETRVQEQAPVQGKDLSREAPAAQGNQIENGPTDQGAKLSESSGPDGQPDQMGSAGQPATHTKQTQGPAGSVNASSEEEVEAEGKPAEQGLAQSEGAVEKEQGALATAGQTREVLQISASQPCWFRAEVDGVVRDVYLRPGESTALHFDEQLEVRLGNAGGVSILYNGQPVDIGATSGEVKTLRFP